MKRINLIGLLLLLALYACNNGTGLSDMENPKNAEKQDISEFDVSQEDAIRVAGMVQLTEADTAATQSKMQGSVKTLKEVFTLKNKQDIPCMHVVNYSNNGGFAIISATQKYLPVLAYSDKGNFTVTDRMPLGLEAWLDMTKGIIGDIKNNATHDKNCKYAALWKKYQEKENMPPMQLMSTSIDDAMMDEVNYWYDQGYQIMSLGINACGDGIPSDVCYDFNTQAEASIYPLYDYQQYALVVSKEIYNTTIKNPLLVTQWNQGPPFNQALNSINGQKPPVGCGAVALGQVMAYHKHPNTYNWNTMLSQGGYSAVTQNFLKDVAIAIGTIFGLNGSSSTTDALVSALKTRYGYSTAVSLIPHNSVIVRAQLYYNQPVIMRGDRLDTVTNGYVGHAWVCDGYETDTYYTEHLLRVPVTETDYTTLNSYQSGVLEFHYYHMNWGWEGTGDGWFFEENVTPSSSQDFKYRRQDIVNIKKR